MRPPRDPYEVLGVPANASPAEIDSAYRQRVRVVHPDRIDPASSPEAWAAANEVLRELNAAYDLVSDPGRSRTQTPRDRGDQHARPRPATTAPPIGVEAEDLDRSQRYRRMVPMAWLALVALLGVMVLKNLSDPKDVPPSAGQGAPTRDVAPTSAHRTSEAGCVTQTFAEGSQEHRDGIIAFTPLMQELPTNGTAWVSNQVSRVAPFEVRVAGAEHFLVKLDGQGITPVLLFVRAGSTAETVVPLGRYTLKYASGGGAQWCGHESAFPFGQGTEFFVADSTLEFGEDGTKYVGHSIELIRQIGGNLHTRQLNASSW